MDVKSVPKISPYLVNTANETRDQDRRQNPARKEETPGTKVAPKPSAQPPSADVAVQSSEADITCQIVDSLKIVQMLSNKPKSVPSATKAFANKATHSPKETKISDGKKVNKSF